MKKVIIKENAASLVSIIIVAVVVIIIIATVIKLVTGGVNVLSKAKSASIETKEAQRVEALNLLFTSYKTDALASDKSNEEFDKYLLELKNNSSIQNYWFSKELSIIKYDDAYFIVKSKKENNIVIGSIPIISDEYAKKTMDNYLKSIKQDSKEKVSFENDNVYIISENVNQSCYEYIIPNGYEVTIAMIDNIEINNKKIEKPAIELLDESILNLYIYGNVEISSLYNGNDEIIYNEITDKPGYAGIHVPVGSRLNIFGNSKLTVRGGPAGKGGTFTLSDYTLGNGGGGAGAGIGGNGGVGGVAAENESFDGGVGGSCGDISLYGTVTVYAYGGAGAQGGDSTKEGAGAGGGYPAAGIGGGGAGGGGATRLVGAGGYSGGAAISVDEEKLKGGIDGLAGSHVEDTSVKEYYFSGGGYLEGPAGIDSKKKNRAEKCLGGFKGVGMDKDIVSSNGGVGGSGGSVILTGNSDVYAYNGNKYTDGFSEQIQPIIINAQNGTTLEKYSYKKIEGTSFTLSRIAKKKKVKILDFGQGIGAGAGFTEGNNGMFKDNTENK